MRRTAIGLGLLTALAAVTALALPWLIGHRAEAWFRTNIDAAARDSSMGWNISLISYERGWAHSAAVVRMAMRVDPDLYVDIDNAIAHVPIPGRGWARVHATPRWPGQVQTVSDYLFDRQPALSANVLADFAGGTTLRINSPAFSKPLMDRTDVTVTWGGLDSTVHLPGDGTYTVDSEIPRLAMTQSGMTVDCDAVRGSGHGTMGETSFDWQGEARVTIAGCRLTNPSGNAVVRDIEATAQQRIEDGIVRVAYRMGAASGGMELDGQPKSDFSDATVELEFDVAEAAMRTYMEGLTAVGVLDPNDPETQRLAAEILRESVAELLKASPAFRLKAFGIRTSAGDAAARADVRFDGTRFDPGAPPAAALALIQLDAAAEISQALLRTWIAGPMPGDEAEQRLAALVEAGLVEVSGASYATRIQFGDAALRINGRPGDAILAALMGPQ